jgi:AhpD family alkylhydroperoxidase
MVTVTEEVGMARIPLNVESTGWLGRVAAGVSRRRYGAVLEPLAAAAHQPWVLWANIRNELVVKRRWRSLDPGLRDLAVVASAARLGCAWCMDFGYWKAHSDGTLTESKLEAIPEWRDSDLFTERERQVLAYAEAMTDTPIGVTDEQVQQLRQSLGDARLVELTAYIALESQRSRFNSALGLSGQGFRDRCELLPA